MTDPSIVGFDPSNFESTGQLDTASLDDAVALTTDTRVHALAEAMAQGYSVERVNELTDIDPWFLRKLEKISAIRGSLASTKLEYMGASALLNAKQAGFSDHQIGMLVGAKEEEVRTRRKDAGIVPWVKQIDTMAAE